MSNSSPINESGLHHQLTAGQMTMVAVGGSIGTGLLLGTASAISLAGPAVILSFVLAAFISWTVALALGELASTHPAAGSFGVYGDLYLNHWAGFISRARGRVVSPGGVLARHRRLHRSRDGRLRHLHAALVSTRTRHPLGLRLFRIPSLHQLPSRPQLRTLRILVLHDQA